MNDLVEIDIEDLKEFLKEMSFSDLDDFIKLLEKIIFEARAERLERMKATSNILKNRIDEWQEELNKILYR